MTPATPVSPPTRPAAHTTQGRAAATSLALHQSDLKTWMACPLRWRYQNIDQLPREQSASLTFGSLMHEAVLMLETTGDLIAAITFFTNAWDDPTTVDPKYKIDYYVRATNWKKYAELGPKILRDWWGLIQWDSDVILGREYPFSVAIGRNGHRLDGTIDKLALRYIARLDTYVVLVSDYKTNNKTPTYDWLADDLQFTAYCYATTQPEFWAGLPDGDKIFAKVASYPRHGEWVSLVNNRRMDAGERGAVQYNRLEYMVDQMADSIALRIFVPNISGEACRYCDFRAQCGLAPIEN